MSYLQNGPKRPTSESFDVACKVMLLGDSGVGKTCVLVRFKDGAFLSGSFISTVGIDYKNKVVEVDGTKVKLQVSLNTSIAFKLLRLNYIKLKLFVSKCY
ncbi:PREDICTED: ras-related protein Rab-26-like [Acropora digitifera]|uniref:ras-related protein Rab-26-like n=1 Tax=Acropora digitifera TaxID=70779 RepID=UPI00077A84ED|nr:PREDICTED: ras-related protein Rab-26-like [Acropora digitifera]